MKFKFEKLIIWQQEFSLHYEFSFNLMNMLVAFRRNIK